MNMPVIRLIAVVAGLLMAVPVLAQNASNLNRADRLEWFRDQGFGLFIHWSVDSQLGSVISHSMVAASPDYLDRFVNGLPKTFNPRKFYPDDWAVLARLAGMRYVVFTAKHHSGFCMYDTATTAFGIMHTPFQRDITAEVLKSFRNQGLAAGLYFSPDDFWWLYKNGKTIQRGTPDVQPRNNPGLLSHDRTQVRELMTRYGKIDVIFFDGEAQGLRELAWELQPDVVVSRGALQTPEQYIPGVPLEGAWEANLTMGTQWQYKPTNEVYKSGGQLIATLIETRAKGGNLLLNMGPKPDGELPIEQEERLREMALWMFINSEMIYGVRPWVVTNENDYWFTKRKDEDTLYVAVKEKERWKYGAWKDIVLKTVRATAQTEASVLSQNDKVLEYQPDVIPKTTLRQETDGLHIRAMFAQRVYNDRKWPNPVVIKLTHVQPAIKPPKVGTGEPRWNAAARAATLLGEIKDLGDATSLEAGFEYRSITGQDVMERTGPWTATALVRRTGVGAYTDTLKGLAPGTYEVRAVVKHPLLTFYGLDRTLVVK
jgi:alpha-L-fucosidase